MLEKCCFCFSLSKGAIILGYLGVSLSSIFLVTGVVSIINLNEYIYKTYSVPSDDVFVYYKTAGLIFLIFFISINFLNLLSCMFLIIGSLQNKRLYLIPWMLTSLFCLTIALGLAIHFGLSAREHALVSAVISSLFFVIILYDLICVYSLYKLITLREKNYPAYLRKTRKSEPINLEASYSKIT